MLLNATIRPEKKGGKRGITEYHSNSPKYITSLVGMSDMTGISDTLTGIFKRSSFHIETSHQLKSTQPCLLSRSAQQRRKTSKTVYDVLWNREIERVPHFENWLPYTMSPGLPSATVLEEAKRDDKPTRTTDTDPRDGEGPKGVGKYLGRAWVPCQTRSI